MDYDDCFCLGHPPDFFPRFIGSVLCPTRMLLKKIVATTPSVSKRSTYLLPDKILDGAPIHMCVFGLFIFPMQIFFNTS